VPDAQVDPESLWSLSEEEMNFPTPSCGGGVEIERQLSLHSLYGILEGPCLRYAGFEIKKKSKATSFLFKKNDPGFVQVSYLKKTLNPGFVLGGERISAENWLGPA
jgi:hypothetical protein